MKSLHTLLKVAQRRLDDLGAEAARIAMQIQDLEAREAAVRAREEAELAGAAGKDPTFAAMLTAYRMRVKQQVGELRAQIAARTQELEDVRKRLSDAYIEKSKFEQLIEQARRREDAERAAREQAQLDEAAITRAGGQGK